MIFELVNVALLTAAVPENRPPEPAPAPEPATVVLQDEEPLNDWTGGIALGLYRAFGNTERRSATLTGDGTLRRENDRFNLGAWWYYASEEDATGVSTITDRRYGGRFKYDYFLSEKSYVFGNTLAERDDLARLQLRWIAGAGYGYQFKEEEDFKLSGEAGLSYVSQDFQTPLPTAEEPNPSPLGPEGFLAARLAYNLEWKPVTNLTAGQTGEVYPSLEGGDDFYSKLNTTLRYDLNDSLFTQFQWLWDYNNNPPTGTQNSDHRLFLTVGYSF